MEFDETQAIAYIREHTNDAAGYDDDELLNLIDMIFDYYESNGLLEIDLDDEDEDLDVDDMLDYIKRMLRKDKYAKLQPEHIASLVEAYLDYENTLD